MGYGPEYQRLGVTQMDPRSLGTGPTGIAALLQRPGLRDALLAAGSALLQQKDQPGTLGGALGKALPIGMQAYQQGQQAAQVDKLIASAPPEMQRLLMSLPKDQRGMALFQMMTAPKPAPVALGANERLVDPSTNETLVDAKPPEEPKPAELPSDLRTVLFLRQVDPATATPEQLDQARQDLLDLKKAGGSGDIASVLGGIVGITKIPTTAQAAVISLQSATGALDDFEKYTKQWMELSRGERTAGKVGVPNAERDALLANLEASQKALLLEIKNLAQLGVLSGPDVGLVTGIIGDPTSWDAILRDPSAAAQKIKQARSYLDRAKKAYEGTYGVTVPKPEASAPVEPNDPDPMGFFK